MADGRFVQHPEVGLALAQSLVATACAEAEQIGIAVSVVVADRAGNVVAAARMDGAALGSMRLATDKAYTAAIWQLPTGDLRRSTQPGGDDWGLTSTEGGRIVVYAGGLPVFVEGELAGAVGVSGGTGDQDAQCVAAAVVTVGSPA
jgi:uncharacterized protein GlcG (DUF336 family)